MASSPTRHHVDVHRVRKCESQKVGYRSKAEAHDQAELMMLTGNVQPGCHVVPYACVACGEWHVGNRVIVQIGRRWR